MTRLLALLALVALMGCGSATAANTPVPTPSPTFPPIPTLPPTPTLTALQATAESVQQGQQATRTQYAQATKTTSCANLFREYSAHGQGFDQSMVLADPERVMVELRIMNGGDGSVNLSGMGQVRERLWREWVDGCAGR